MATSQERAATLYDRIAAPLGATPTYTTLDRWSVVKEQMDAQTVELAAGVALLKGEVMENVAVEIAPVDEVDLAVTFEAETADAIARSDVEVIDDALVFTIDGTTIHASAPELVNGGISFTVVASNAKGPLPTDNPYVFINPPLAKLIGFYGDGAAIIQENADTHLENIQVMIHQAMVGTG